MWSHIISCSKVFPSFIAVLVRRDKPMQSGPINEDEAAFERVAEGRIQARLVNFSLPQRVFHHSTPVITPPSINSPTLPLHDGSVQPENWRTVTGSWLILIDWPKLYSSPIHFLDGFHVLFRCISISCEPCWCYITRESKTDNHRILDS